MRLYGGVRLLGSGPCLENVERLDMGAMPMIHYMMTTGLQVDLSHFAKMETELVRDMEEITEKVYAMTGYYLNLDSGDQVSELLFKKLGLKQARPKMTKTGDRESVEEEVLLAIQHDHPVVPQILVYKEYSKLKGTYVTPMPKLAKRSKMGDWRMYPKLGSTRVPSGRLNCKEPNLLAMPNRTERGREVCKGFIAPEGWVFLSVDESQIEPRIITHRSMDKNLFRIYQKEEDIYSDFAIKAFKLQDVRYECWGPGSTYVQGKVCDNVDHAASMHGWHYPSVHKKKNRFPAKTCILASFYDVSPPGLLEQMPIVCKNCEKDATLHDCGKFESFWNENNCGLILADFYQQYPEVLTMRKKDHAIARRYGYLWDMWGRILHVAAVRSIHEWVVSAALREAGNFPIQSGAQGTIKLAMAEVQDGLRAGRMLDDICKPVLQIHDELLFYCREDMAQEVGAYVAEVFEKCVPLNVPIKASIATANTWGSMPK